MSIIRLDDQPKPHHPKTPHKTALVAAAPRGMVVCTRCHQQFPAGQYPTHVRTSDHPRHQPIDIKTGRL